jgi:hypothetical protein
MNRYLAENDTFDSTNTLPSRIGILAVGDFVFSNLIFIQMYGMDRLFIRSIAISLPI